MASGAAEVFPRAMQAVRKEWEQMSKSNKSKEKKASLMGFGITLIGLGLLTRPFSLVGILLVAGAAYVVGKTIGIMSGGLDTTTHNKQDMNRAQPVESIPNSGNSAADETLTKGQEMLRQIREANDAIPDPELTKQMYQLEDKCVQLFRTVADKPDKAPQIRKFMNYYLPTTLKMLNSYRDMQNSGVSQGELANARATMRRGMDMVITACQKQLDNLYKDTMLDVSTDIDVLEQMLKRDGFADGGLGEESMEAARTAAAAQMGANVVPTLDTTGTNDDFDSYYQLKNQRRS